MVVSISIYHILIIGTTVRCPAESPFPPIVLRTEPVVRSEQVLSPAGHTLDWTGDTE